MDIGILQEPKERIIFAADVGSIEELIGYLRIFKGEIGAIKIGMELLTHALLTGAPVFSTILEETDFRIMWDLKYFDIPPTVAGAAKEVAKHCQGRILGFTVHCLSARKALKQAVQAVKENFGEGPDSPEVIGVTLLTSLDKSDLKDLGIKGESSDVVERWTKMAIEEGVRTFVCSGQETKMLLDIKSDLITINPGIRFLDSNVGDQKRVVTPRRAIGQGATFIVMGSDLRKGDPVANARRAAKEIGQGLTERIC